MIEKALLVTVYFEKTDNIRAAQTRAAELAELSRAARLEVVDNFVWKQKAPQAALLVGKGKAESLVPRVKSDKINVVVFDSDLSPSQQRNLEEILGVKTIDRTQLILDIFALRARSLEGKLQVELAQLKYLLPRLGGKGIYLSRLGGGVGTRGPGEQKLEVDRRRIRERITKFSDRLKMIEARTKTAIEQKKELGLPLIALVGYTNAGKSTLFNALSSAGTLVKDQLFSTLDTTTRMIELPGSQKAFLVDTVGFVRHLPHHLVESFKATLEEVRQADLLLHVSDVSDPGREELERSVESTLAELGAEHKRTLRILNKVDLAVGPVKVGSEEFLVSAKSGAGIELLRAKLTEEFSKNKEEIELVVPYKKQNRINAIYEFAEVLRHHHAEDGVHFWLRVSEKNKYQLLKSLR